MYRMLLALVAVGVLALVAPGTALSQEKKSEMTTEKAEKAPLPKEEQEFYVIKVTKTSDDRDHIIIVVVMGLIIGVIGLAIMALILYLIMIRSRRS